MSIESYAQIHLCKRQSWWRVYGSYCTRCEKSCVQSARPCDVCMHACVHWWGTPTAGQAHVPWLLSDAGTNLATRWFPERREINITICWLNLHVQVWNTESKTRTHAVSGGNICRIPRWRKAQAPSLPPVVRPRLVYESGTMYSIPTSNCWWVIIQSFKAWYYSRPDIYLRIEWRTIPFGAYVPYVGTRAAVVKTK